MIRFTTPLFEQLNDELTEIGLQSDNILQRAERSHQSVQRVIQKINERILTYTFKDPAEEIHFFKEIKPMFLRELIYYSEVYHIEAHIPVGNTDMLRQHYQLGLERIRAYFVRNEILYNYYRTNKTLYDALFFLRNQLDEINIIENAVDIDHRCCTVYSMKLAKLQAYEMVKEYLQTNLYKLDNPEWLPKSNGHKFKNLWTDSKAALTEVAYMFYARGSVNHGKAELRQIVADLEIMFNVNLGNYTRTFTKLKMRKKSPTPYLDDGKNDLIKLMEEDLE